MINQTERQARVPIIQGIIDELTDRTEGCDLMTVLSIVWDAGDPGEPFDEWVKSAGIARHIITATQSNPRRSANAMIRAGRLDDAIARYGDEDPEF